MQRKLLLGLTLVSSLLLTGCSWHNQNVAIMHHARVTQSDVYNKYKATAAGKKAITTQVIDTALESLYGDQVSQKQVNKNYRLQEQQAGGAKKFAAQLSSSQYTKASYKQSLRENLLLVAAGTAHYQLTAADKKQIKKHNVRKRQPYHILVKSPAQARIVLNKLQGGAAFSTLAKQYSTDKGSATRGGKLTAITVADKKAYVPEFYQAFKKLKVGQYTKTPIKTKYGYHIIYRGRDVPPLSTAKAQKEYIRSKVEHKLSNQTFMLKTMKQVINDADVDVKDADIKSTLNNSLNRKPTKKSQQSSTAVSAQTSATDSSNSGTTDNAATPAQSPTPAQ